MLEWIFGEDKKLEELKKLNDEVRRMHGTLRDIRETNMHILKEVKKNG